MARRRRSYRRASRRAPRRRRASATPVRRRRRSRGGFLGRGKFGIAMPTIDAAYIGIAAAAGEVIMLLLEKFGVPVPDWIPEKALGIWLFGWWKKNPALQQVGYGLIVVELLENSGVVDKAKGAVGVSTQGALPPGATADEEEELGNIVDLVPSIA
jgi:hypothetical protein